MMSMKFEFIECYMDRTGFSSLFCLRSLAGITCHNSSGAGVTSELIQDIQTFSGNKRIDTKRIENISSCTC